MSGARSASRSTPVSFVVDGALDQPTGGYVYDQRVIAGLTARGADVSVIHLHGHGAWSSMRENLRFARHLASAGIVVVDELCHPRVAWAARAWAMSARRPRRTFLVTLVHHLAKNEVGRLRAIGRLAVERALLGVSDRLVVTSTTTRQDLIAIGVPRERIRVALPGRDRLGTRDRPPEPAPDGTVRLLFVGSVTPRKGVLALLSAFESITARATLTVAGPLDRDRAYAAAVARRAARLGDRVRVLGTVSDASLAALLSTHDALVLPSCYEGFGIVLAEAVSHGLAIVATRAGAIGEVVRDGAEAVLVPPNEIQPLAMAIQRICSDAGRLRDMQRRALERAATLPTWSETEAAFARAIDPADENL